MADRSWMPMYWGDYVRDTLHLSVDEHGAYLLLIAAYWVNGKPLPDDDKQLARICRVTTKRWLTLSPRVMEFFSAKDGVLVHKRVEKELLRVSVRSAAASANARSSRARAGTQPQPDSESKGETPSLANPETQNSSRGVSGRHSPNGEMPHQPPSNGIAKPKPDSRGTRLPEDWEPGSEGIEYATNLGMTAEQIRASYGAFMRHWLAKAGTAGRKLRWDLTWQTWVRNDYERIREKAERDSWRKQAARH